MANPPHSFKIMDIKTDTPIRSMLWVNLMSAFNGHDDVAITLGDVTLRNGVADAWYAAEFLPDDSKSYVILAILPAYKRMLERINISKTHIKKCTQLIERYSLHKKVWDGDVQKIYLDLLEIQDKLDYDILTKYGIRVAIQLVRFISSENIKITIGEVAINMFNTMDPMSTITEPEKQIADICRVFPPLITKLEIG